MKKGKKLILTIVMVLLLMFAALLVYRIFFDDGPEYFFTIEECEEATIGEWIDPTGQDVSFIFNADKTGNILGEDITWEIGSRIDEGNGNENATYLVNYYYEGSEESDGFVSFEYYDEWDTVVCLRGDDYEDNSYRSRLNRSRYKENTVEIVTLNANNFEQYFEVAGEPIWYEKDGEKSWLGYTHYLYLKPDCAKKCILFNGLQDYTYKCVVRCNEVPYDAVVDLDEGSCLATKPNKEKESELKEYNVTYDINWTHLMEQNLRVDGAARLIDFETDEEGVGIEGRFEVVFDVMEDIEIVDATGVIVFFK